MYLLKWNIEQIFLDDITMFFGILDVTASHNPLLMNPFFVLERKSGHSFLGFFICSLVMRQYKQGCLPTMN